MCLTVDPNVQVPFDDEGKCEVLKALFDHGRLFRSPYYLYEWEPGKKYYSGRLETELSEKESVSGRIDHGFHVLLDEAQAEATAQELADGDGTTAYVCAFEARAEDLVAAGTWEGKQAAVFRSLRALPEPDFVVCSCDPVPCDDDDDWENDAELCDDCGAEIDWCTCYEEDEE